MKNSIALILLVFLPALLSAQILPYPDQLASDAAAYKKSGIKTVRVYTSSDEMEEILTETRQYDENGRIVEKEQWHPADEDYRTWHYQYNDEGRLIMATEETGDHIHYLTEYNYKADRLIHEQHSDMEYGAYDMYYIYDQEGRIDTSLLADAEPRKSSWHYNKKGRLDSIVGYTVQDYENPDEWSRVEVETFRYGKKGVLVRESFCGIYSGCYIHDYSYKKKKKVLDVVSGSDGEIYRSYFEYDGKLLVREEKKASEEMSYMMEDEVIRYEYDKY